MNRYLSQVFGDRVVASEYRLPGTAPFYLVNGYTTEKFTLDNSECIIITPTDTSARLPVLKKHYGKICEISGLPCALHLEKLTAGQRENLISDNIPFVSGLQVYLPFWGTVFTAKLNAPREISESMTPTTQLVFLYVFYRLSADRRINASIVSEELKLPKSTAAKAVQDLCAYGLLKISAAGTNKWISFNGESSDVLNRAMPLMRTPVRKEVWLKSVPDNIPYMLGGIRALSENSMLASNERDGAIVYSGEKAKQLPNDLLICKRDFDDFGGVAAEVWKYEPSLLSDGATVDELSLFVCLKDNEDERVQKELDSIRERFGITEVES